MHKQIENWSAAPAPQYRHLHDPRKPLSPCPRSPYKRILLKLSGESFAAPASAASACRRSSTSRPKCSGRAARRRDRHRHRRRQHSSRRTVHRGQLERPRSHGPLHGHAGHGDQRPRAARRAGIARLPDAADDGDPHGRRCRAVHSPPRAAAFGEGTDRDPRRRHRRAVRHDRHRRRPEGDGARSRHSHEGDPRRRRLQRRSRERSRCDACSASSLSKRSAIRTCA